jgi:hypothetical protein
MEKVTVYDKEELFKKDVKPLLDELMRVCAVNKIPAFFTCAVKSLPDQTVYSSDMFSGVTNNVTLKNDNIVKMANVLNGFDVVAENKSIEIEL